jgi:hypothetical protein
MFKYEYVADEPKRDYRLLITGRCKFEVLECKSTKKTGEGYSATIKGKKHPALMVKFMVTDCQGVKEYVYDLIFHWKLKALLNAANALNLYNKGGAINEESLIKLKGHCEIEHEEQVGYGTKNKIKMYCYPDTSKKEDERDYLEKEKQESASKVDLDDDVPF